MPFTEYLTQKVESTKKKMEKLTRNQNNDDIEENIVPFYNDLKKAA